MKKIIVAIMLITIANSAPTKDDVVKELAPALINMAVGVLMFPGLVIGDAQWQYYTNRDECNLRHSIKTFAIVPPSNTFRFSVPCKLWFKKD